MVSPEAVVVSPDDHLFHISAKVLGEREIDIDDREATWEIVLSMASTGYWALKAIDVKVFLVFQFDRFDGMVAEQPENIAILDPKSKQWLLTSAPHDPPKSRDEYAEGAAPDQVEIEFGELYPNVPVARQVKVRTGVFAGDYLGTHSAQRTSARPGNKRVGVRIAYDLRDTDPAAGASLPTTLQIPVAPD